MYMYMYMYMYMCMTSIESVDACRTPGGFRQVSRQASFVYYLSKYAGEY